MSAGAIPPTGDTPNIPPVPPSQPLGYDTGAAAIETDPQAKTFGMLCHLLAFAGLFIPYVGNIVGPLVMWLLKKDQYAFVNDQGKEALNFQITCTIAGLIAGVLLFLVIGFLLLPIIVIAWIVLTIIGTINASNGKYYRYPVCLRLIK